MRIRVLLISAIVATLLLTGVAYTFYDGGGDRGKVLVDLLMRSMEQLHYNPKIVDDQFSETFFDEYLDNVDFNKQFLTQRDIDNLARFRYRIDDELQNGTFEFFELSYNIFDRRRNEIGRAHV
jgi:carboxyl-terminal processing protease